ncbi:MAG: hypothetical protein FGM57_01110 [Candidatus Taylorbacteria bacterium]|nr:hypothetical protein [Candidatus Taylorbacteria bacterium]
MDFISSYLSTLNITLIAVVLLLTIISFYRGRSILYSIILAYFPAAILYASFPYKKQMLFFQNGADQLFYSNLIIFLIFFCLSFFGAIRIVHSGESRAGLHGFIDALVLSISVVLLTTALTFHILPYKDIYNLGTLVQSFLSSKMGYFVSTLVPVITIYWMTRRYQRGVL